MAVFVKFFVFNFGLKGDKRMANSYVIKCEKGYVKYNTRLGDYNQNCYFEGFSNEPKTFFSSEFSANREAKLCELKNFEIISQ